MSDIYLKTIRKLGLQIEKMEASHRKRLEQNVVYAADSDKVRNRLQAMGIKSSSSLDTMVAEMEKLNLNLAASYAKLLEEME